MDQEASGTLMALFRERFPKHDLTPAEERLLANVESGELIDYAPGEEPDPSKAAEWGPERTLSSRVIAWLADRNVQERLSWKGIQVRGAKVVGRLDLSFVEFPFPLKFVSCAFEGDVLLNYSRVKTLAFTGSRISRLAADGVKVDGDVFLDKGFHSQGEVRLVGATIGGDLACVGGKFTDPGGKALNADRAQINGSVFLSDGFEAQGEVRLLGATVGSVLDCEAGKFINPDGRALSADGLQITGSVFLRDGFEAQGRVSFVSASIRGFFIWTGVPDPKKVTLDLRSAEIAILWDDEASWPERGNFFLDGLVYHRLGGDSPCSAKARISWLRRQPDDRFYPQPYEQLAKVLRETGHDEDAKKVLIAKERDPQKLKLMSRPRRALHWLLYALTGYGYRPWLTLVWALGLVLLGWGVFRVAAREGLMVPTGTAFSSAQVQLYPLAYSIDVFLPIIDLGQARAWVPRDASTFGLFALCFSWWLDVAGWVLTTLFLASLTGFIQRRM